MYEANNLWDLPTGSLDTNFDRFVEFHRKNPDVFRKFIEELKSVRLRHKGKRKNYSARTIFEWMRHNWAKSIDTDEPWRISNNNIPFYARMAILHYPEWFGSVEQGGNLEKPFLSIKGGGSGATDSQLLSLSV